MLFNYAGKHLNIVGSSTLQTNTQSVSNLYMNGGGGGGRTQCNRYSMRGTMHTKSNPKKRCNSCQ